MRLIFWIVSMMFTISANASLNLDSLVPLKTKTPFFKNDSVFNAQRFALVSGSSILALVGSYYYINSAWWADSRKSFHFDGGGSNITDAFDFGRDMTYAKGLDKIGHFYGARITSDLFARGIRWSGKTEAQSLIWGGLLGTAVQGFIEVKDGFSPTWGFSIYDWISGSLGSFYPYFQSKSKFLNALDIKYSYYRKHNYYFDFIKREGNFQDDYMNSTFWVTFNPKRYKPESRWPKWLGISFGIGVDKTLNNYYINSPGGYSDWGKGGYEFYIAPDIDFKGLLPKKPFWQSVAHLLNYIKVPTPAFRLSRDSKLMPIHF
jgi:hypothetical protein